MNACWPGTPTFSDVPASSGFYDWIEEFVDQGFTAGCGGGKYCPGNPVTRGQMAVFLSKAFALYVGMAKSEPNPNTKTK